MVKAMKARVGNPLTKLVLIKLADNANDQGECWPSYRHIADQCEINRTTAIRHVEILEVCGFLRKEERFGGPKGNSSNLFHLTIERGVVAQNNQGSGGEQPGGSGGEQPRTSHSLEPVNEPLSSDKSETSKKIPFEKIRVIYQEVCGSIMKPAVKMTAQRESNIRACWNHSENGVKVFRSADFWKTYFEHCLLNDHWRNGTATWKASLEFLTRKSIMEPTVEELMLKLGVTYDPA